MEHSFIEVGVAYSVGLFTPGPATALIIKNGLIHSRIRTILASVGIMTGMALQSGMVLMGLSVFEPDSIIIRALKILSSLYLLYLGVKVFFKYATHSKGNKVTVKEIQIKSDSQFMEGFLLEFLNPLAFSFFVSIVSVVIGPTETVGMKLLYWLEIVCMGLLWFCSIAVLVTSSKIGKYVGNANKPIELLAGAVFTFFGVKLSLF